MAYYRTEEGKEKKRIQNIKRRRVTSTSEGESHRAVGVPSGGSRFEVGMVVYLAMVTSLIEGRTVSKEEVLEMLKRAVRQHSMARAKRTDYVVWHLNRGPP